MGLSIGLVKPSIGLRGRQTELATACFDANLTFFDGLTPLHWFMGLSIGLVKPSIGLRGRQTELATACFDANLTFFDGLTPLHWFMKGYSRWMFG
jgi:hypothetical protein